MSIWEQTFAMYEKLRAAKLNSLVSSINTHNHNTAYYLRGTVDSLIANTSQQTYDQNVIIEANSGTPNTKVDVNADILWIEDTRETSLDVTIDVGTIGANGLDAGSMNADTWYYVWAIYNSSTSTASCLLSTSRTAPIMPTNYSKKRLIGYRKTASGSANISAAFQFMNRFMYDIPRELTTTVSVGTWSAAEDCSASIPTGVRVGIFSLFSHEETAGDAGIWIRPNGSTWATHDANGLFVDSYSSQSGVGGQRICMTDSSQQIQYRNDWANNITKIDVEGFICGLF